MTILAKIQAIIAQMKPSPPNFMHELGQMANVRMEDLTAAKPLVIYIANYRGELGGDNQVQERQNFIIEFLYRTDMERSELLYTAALREKAKQLAIQFLKLANNSGAFEPFGNVPYFLIQENVYDYNYVGVALEFPAVAQPGTCYPDVWTGVLSVTPSAPQSAVSTGAIVTYTVTGNTDWTVTSNQSWAVVSPASGFEDGTVEVTVAANTSIVSRSATITFSGVGVSNITRVINQAGV